MILLIDNYDSFSYNLYQLIGRLNPDIWVVRNDEIGLADIVVLNPSHIVISLQQPTAASMCPTHSKECVPHTLVECATHTLESVSHTR
jgi:anthranilate synthase component 2